MQTGRRRQDLAAETLAAIDSRIAEILEEQRVRAETIVREQRALIELLRDMLIEKKTIDSKTLGQLIPKTPGVALLRESAWHN